MSSSWKLKCARLVPVVGFAALALTGCRGELGEAGGSPGASLPPRDAGFPRGDDAGLTTDSGSVRVLDAGPRDAGTGPDASPTVDVDAGSPVDAGPPVIDPFGPDPDVTTVQRGIDHVEGPTWVPDENGFVYHTRPNVHRLWRPGESSTSSWFTLPGGNHGSHYNDGYVYLANRRPAEIARVRVSDKRYESLGVQTGGDALFLPNDIDQFSDGTLYFSDWGGASTPSNYIGYGVYRRYPDGRLDRMIGDLDQPNGVAFTADCRTLYVTDNPELMRYDVSAGGSLSGKRVHFQTSSMNGLAVDAQNNVYTVSRNRVIAIDDDGDEVGHVDLPGHTPVNLAFGGADRRWLLITTTDGVLATRTLIDGAECNGLGTGPAASLP